MANVEKYTKAAIGHMFDHYARYAGDKDRSNKDIDPERTILNYNLAMDKGRDQKAIFDERMAQTKHIVLDQGRKDINVMCDWVVTLPQELKESDEFEQRDFFVHCYDFLRERYGEKNVLSAWVHMDETTPHLHFAFMPVVKDEDGTERLCCKEVLTRTELKRFHPELQAYVEEKLGKSVGILNGATEGGNLTITELKTRQAIEKLAQLNAQTVSVEEAQTVIDSTLAVMTEVKGAFERLDESLKAKKWFGDDDKAKMSALKKELGEINGYAQRATEAANALQKACTGLNENVMKQVEDALEGVYTANKAALRRIKRTERKLERREQRIIEQEEELARQKADLAQRNAQLDAEVSKRVKERTAEERAEAERQKARADRAVTRVNELLDEVKWLREENDKLLHPPEEEEEELLDLTGGYDLGR